MAINNFLRLRNAKPTVMEGTANKPVKVPTKPEAPSLSQLPMGLKLNNKRSKFYGD